MTIFCFEHCLRLCFYIFMQVRNINKTLQIGDDTYVENLLRVLNTLCEHCLPSILATLIAWYEKQLKRFDELR